MVRFFTCRGEGWQGFAPEVLKVLRFDSAFGAEGFGLPQRDFTPPSPRLSHMAVKHIALGEIVPYHHNG